MSLHTQQRSVQLEPVILDTIDRLRAEHSSCTARRLAAAMRIQVETMKLMLSALRARHLVVWTDMPGSLRTVRSQVPMTPPPAGPISGPVPAAVAEVAAEVVRQIVEGAPVGDDDVPETFPVPTLTRNDDGTITLDWPVGLETTPVAHEALAGMIDVHNRHVDQIAQLERDLVDARRLTYVAEPAPATPAPPRKAAAKRPAKKAHHASKSAATRASRPPTPAELAHREKLAQGARDRAALRRASAAAAGGEPGGPQGEGDAEQAGGGDEGARVVVPVGELRER